MVLAGSGGTGFGQTVTLDLAPDGDARRDRRVPIQVFALRTRDDGYAERVHSGVDGRTHPG